MADLKISQLTAITTLTPATDVLPVVDVTGTTKKITTNQILGSGGTATLASATITGDLTVDTSTLKVDSANDRVGIGTATPANACQIQGAGQATVTPTVTGDQSALSLIDSGFAANNGGMLTFGSNVSNGYIGQAAIKSLLVNGTQNGTSDLAFFTRGAASDSTLAERYRIAVNGVATWSNVGGTSGTAMTLNATGLGVGTSPANGIKLASYVTTAGVPVTSGTTQSAGSLRIGAASTAGVMDMGTAGSYSWIQPCNATNLATNYDLVLNQNGGNVGIGVTSPTYKLQTTVASGANRNIFAAQIAGASNGFEVLWNHATTTLRVIVSNLPTSSAGLASGTLWIDTSAGNTLKVA